MNRITAFLPVLAFALLLSACAESPDTEVDVIDQDTTMTDRSFDALGTDTTDTTGVTTETDLGTAEMRDGVQEVRINVRSDGYTPSHIALREGVPARLIFVAESNTGCASQVQIPHFGINRTDLAEGQETVVEFTPEETGEFTFACGMDMVEGSILVRA